MDAELAAILMTTLGTLQQVEDFDGKRPSEIKAIKKMAANRREEIKDYMTKLNFWKGTDL